MGLERLHTFIRDTSRRERSGFVRAEHITEAVNAASSDLWKSLIQKLRRTGDLDILLQPFRDSSTITSGGSYTLSGGAEYEILSLEPTDSSEPEIYLSKNNQDATSARLSREFEHVLKSDSSHTINAAANGLSDLPDDYFKHLGVVYHDFDGGLYEGQILEEREWIDRRNSVVVPADTENPIARIHDDKIEFYPRPTGADTYDFTLPYMKFNPVATFDVSGSDVVFTFKPSSYSLDTRVNYIKTPVLATATYGTAVNGIQPITVTQDIDWNEQAFPELATRALIYIGVTVNDALIAQIDQATEQGDSSDIAQ